MIPEVVLEYKKCEAIMVKSFIIFDFIIFIGGQKLMKNIQIRGENVEVTPALKTYAEEKLERLERFFTQPFNNVYVNFKIYKVGQKVEVTIPLIGLLLRAEEKSSDLYAAIDLVVDKLERQIRKYKTRIQKVRVDSFGKDNRSYLELPEEVASDNQDPINEEQESLVITRKKSLTLNPMSEQEAILQMELLQHEFFIFADSETYQPSIVYKRKDGHYGLIETN